MNLHDLLLRMRALVAPRRVERELDEELAFHIERETQKHVANGLSPAEARTRALARFGSVPLAADQCRDARGIGVVDDLTRDILYAFRTFRRAPLAALTIVATIALGLGLVAAVFTFYNDWFLRVDAVHKPGELFAVERPTGSGADSSVPFTRAEYEALRRETSVFTDVVAMVRGIETRIEGRPASPILVTGNFFQVLGVQAALGRTFTPADDEPSAGRRIVFSHRGWIKFLAGDPTVIGRSLPVNGVPCEVVGVMPEDFRGLGIGSPDYWAPLALARELRQTDAGREDDMPVDDVVGRLRPGVSPEQATAGLSVWASGRTNLKTAGDRPAPIRLEPRDGTLSADWLEVLAVSSPMFFAFGLILAIGCANVANLLLARGVSRQREIGIRLSLGASRRRVIRQLLTESLILALTSAACGFAVSRICLQGALYAATTTMPAEVAEAVDLGVPSADWRVLVFLIAGAIVSTVSFGLVPALQATRVELIRASRGEVTRDTRPGRARHALIAVQVGAAALLLICAAVFLRSAFAAALVEPGVRTSDTLAVPIANEPRRAAILREVTSHPSVAAVAAVWPLAQAEASAFAEATADEADDSAEPRRSVQVDYKFVSPEYFQLLDIDLLRGRGFTDAERTADAGVTVVSESAARALWPTGDAVGQVVHIRADHPTDLRRPSALLAPSRAYTVIGIARDVGGAAMFQFFSFSGVYLPVDPQTPGTSLMLRVRGDPGQARLALLDRLLRVDPALDHEVRTMRTMAGMGAYILQIVFWVTVVLGGLALVLTVSGLFSVLSYLVEQRTKEIGVRMALGATTRNIGVLVLSQSIRPVGVGLVAGGGLAAGLAILLLSMPGASQIGSTVQVLDPVAYAASLLVIVTTCALAASVPALRAARLDPIATLRQD
ncbi:MAG: FtsX-like permease family protein [Luteitalea sp.]|nr:FtsX-like permease family protein [Luteitalea sp.]